MTNPRKISARSRNLRVKRSLRNRDGSPEGGMEQSNTRPENRFDRSSKKRIATYPPKACLTTTILRLLIYLVDKCRVVFNMIYDHPFPRAIASGNS
mmetsp:Transcript_6432/g.12852  ORF Transcript_6432/g.12852 Transcript_6432/m.12852 type:complete len:96 (-) Transcript_6432:1198-1485(-)